MQEGISIAEAENLYDELRQRAVSRAENLEQDIMRYSKILLRRCTMCGYLSRSIIDYRDERENSDIIKDAINDIRLHHCMEEVPGGYNKVGILYPIGVLRR